VRLLFGVLLLLSGCEHRAVAERHDPPPPRAPAPPAPPEAAIVWVGGDVLLSGAMRRALTDAGDPARGFATLLEPTMKAIHELDGGAASFVLVNLETPVAREVRNENDAFMHEKVGERRVRAPLNSPEWLLDGLRRAGVDGVMLANNHALDQEREGLAETIDAARARGLVITGAGYAPSIGWPIAIGSPPNDVAIFSYIERDFPEPILEPGEAGIRTLGLDSLVEIQIAHERGSAVIVVIHVVAELQDRVKSSWRSWAEDLASAGADAILFHGTHVPLPVETIERDGRTITVAYGLGNLVSDMGSGATPTRRVPEDADKWELPETREGLFARVEIGGDERVTVSFLPIFMSSTRWLVHNFVVSPPIEFELLPLAACGEAHDLPREWPEPWRRDALAWMTERRDHLLEAAALESDSCVPGRVALLE
jgi:hypothetical protein